MKNSANPSAGDIAYALGGKKTKKNRDGWLTLCPCHDDNNPSMSIKDGENGIIDIMVDNS